MSRIINQASLQNLTLEELHALQRRVREEFNLSAPGSKERANALLNLSELERAITLRAHQRPGLR